jgi:two-component system chemotaxis sensor kinase CheA
MAIRMVPISLMFSRFSRLVRDLAGKMNKHVGLKINGGETEVDKSMIEKLIDPMTHLVRNSLDHGIETPEQRASAGKDPKGVITLSAYHQGGKIIIEVSDDGAGLNRQKILEKAREKGMAFDEAITDQELWQFIFLPGFSTAEKVTEVSGRGVGMDVVKRNVHGVGGRIEIRSEPGRGSKFIISLPLTLSIIEGMTLRIGKEIYIIPLISIVESVRPKKSGVKTIAGKGEVLDVRGTYIPIVRLYRQFKVLPDLTDPCQAVLVIVEAEGRRIAMMVDELVGQQQVVIKSLQDNYRKVEGFSGATILGDGQVAFILDVLGLIGTTEKKEELFSEVKN